MAYKTNNHLDPRLEYAIEQYDIFQLLDECEVDYTMEGKNIGNGFIGISPCPNCGDNRNHCAIHVDKKFMTCFICKYYLSLPYLIAHYKGIRLNTAINYLVSGYKENKDPYQQVIEIIKYKPKVKEFRKEYKHDEMPPSKIITKKDIELNSTLRSFLKSRRITLKQCQKYKLRVGTDSAQ
jgi:hypothetical protein